jgi:predicted RNA-binding protein
MCEANVYMIRDGEEELVMEAVDKIEPEDSGLRLVNIFGDQKFVHAHIHSLAFSHHKIFLKE